MRKRVLAAVGVCVVGLAAAQVLAEAGKTAVVWPAADIKWTDNPAIKGAKGAVLWGDPKAGGYGMLKSLPAGSSLAMHTHSQDQKVICISGTITLAIDGMTAKDLGAGSYTFIPGSMKHKADCKAGADCVYFEEAAGAFDITFAK